MLFLFSSLLNLVSKLPFHPVLSRCSLIRVFSLTPRKLLHVRLECSTHGRNGETSSQLKREGVPARYVQHLHVMNNREMNYWLAWFVHEVWRRDGKPYPLSTMQQIVAGLQHSVHEYHSVAGHLTTVNFFQKDNSQFSLLRSALDARMKELTRQNVDTHVVVA